MMAIQDQQSRSRTRSVTVDVISTIADRLGVPETELHPPMYEVIDTDALDAIVRHPSSSVSVRFPYAGYEVAVAADGTITLEMAEQ